jgi:glycosyltransferase involved in cell wall biosynthesis
VSEPSREGWVSVVIPAYNRASRLAASVNSCLEQTYDKVEVIVVDDGSTDDTVAVLEALVTQWGAERVRWVSQPNQGACVARNTGLEMVRTEYFQFHDSDDLLMPDKFTEQVAALERTGADCAVSDILLVADDPEHTPVQEIRYDLDFPRVAGDFQHASIPTVLMRRSTFPGPLRWNTALPRLQDVDFVVRYMLSIRQVVYTPGFHVLYVHHDGPQIRDSYDQGPLYHVMFEQLVDYWVHAEPLIPAENHVLFRRAAATLAWRAALNAEGSAAREILGFSLQGPDVLRRTPKGCVTALISTIPTPALHSLRLAKRWFVERRRR